MDVQNTGGSTGTRRRVANTPMTTEPATDVQATRCSECSRPQPILVRDWNTPADRGMHDTRDPKCWYAQVFDAARSRAKQLAAIDAYAHQQAAQLAAALREMREALANQLTISGNVHISAPSALKQIDKLATDGLVTIDATLAAYDALQHHDQMNRLSDNAARKLYQLVIGASWEHTDDFDLYQETWNVLSQLLGIEEIANNGLGAVKWKGPAVVKEHGVTR